MRSARLAAAVPLFVLSILVTAVTPSIGAAGAPVPIGPSAIYQRLYRPEVPWAIHVVEADLSDDFLEARALLGGGNTMARRQLSDILAAAESEIVRPVAAVNADFFALSSGSYAGIPLGLHISQGELVTFPDPARSVFYVLDDGSAHIGRLRPNVWLWGPGELLYPIAAMNRPPRFSDVVLFTPRIGEETRVDPETTQIALVGLTGPFQSNSRVGARVASVTVGGSQRIPPDGAVVAARGVGAYALRNLAVGDEVTLSVMLDGEEGSIREAIGGGPRLVRRGEASVEHERERFSSGFSGKRHPRSGVGIREGTVVMVAVDGRQPGYSDGMTLYELAELFVELGCSDAMNLDGGGSATMVVRGCLVNTPSGGVERAVANGLAILSVAPLGPPVAITIEPGTKTVLCGERVALRARGVDQYYNPVEVEAERVSWEATPGLGTVSEAGVFTAAETAQATMGLVMARVGEMETSAVLTVTPAPARVVVRPERVVLGTAGEQYFAAQAYDADNVPMSVPPERLEWRVEPEVAGCAIDQTGLLRATEGEGEVTVVADVGGTCGTAAVVMGTGVKVVEGFESTRVWTFRARPADAPGTAGRVEETRHSGRASLRLQYDLSEGEGTRTAEVEIGLQLPETRAFSVQVMGDGQGAWLRARLRDGAGRAFAVDLADRIGWSGSWRKLTAALPEEAEAPVTLESVYVAEYREDRMPVGEIFLDDVTVLPAPPRMTAPPEVAPEPTPKTEPKTEPEVEPVLEPAVEPGEALESEPGEEGSEEMGELPIYVCRKTVEPITIDGHLTEPVWSRLESVGDFAHADGSGEPSLPTEVRVCWDDTNLYLAFVAVDTDIWGRMRERDDPIYDEEVVEAFLSSSGDVTKYFEFEWSPHNVVFDATIQCPESGDRSQMTADVAWDCKGATSAVQVVGTLDDSSDIDERWTVEVALPFASIGRDGKPPVDGEEWRANFYRIDRAGAGEFSCWSPTLADPPSFHVPARFGRLRFSIDAL